MTNAMATHSDPYSPKFICRYCGADRLARTAAPDGVSVDEWHGNARCVEGDEPSYKMGGPA